jgi:hypothetical protein
VSLADLSQPANHELASGGYYVSRESINLTSGYHKIAFLDSEARV